MEKGLTYYDLAENDYQFLLKDWQDGRVGNIMCSSAKNICERYLKHVIDAYITECDTTRILQTHSLKALRRFMQEYIPEFTCKWKIILQADGYYFSTRYPGDTAFLVAKEDVDEFLKEIELQGEINTGEDNLKNLLLEKDERLVYSCLSLRPKNVGELLEKTGILVPDMMDVLARLLQKGFITETVKNYYIRKI